MKIDVLLERQLNLEGSGGSRNRRFSRRFFKEVKRAPLGGTFGDFCDFWVPLGVEKGSILDQKLHLFGGLIFGWMGHALFGDFGRGRRHGRAPLGSLTATWDPPGSCPWV